MIKKRLLSFLGAAAITAALTFAVVSLSPSNGFTSGTMQEGLCYEATGVAPDAIVASLNGNGASADLVAYWIGYDVSYLNSYMQYYTGSSINWDDTLSDGMSVADYVKASVLSSVKQHLVLENLANKYGVTLTEGQESAMADSDQTYIDQYGSEEAFEEEIAKLGMRRETYDRVARSNYLYQNLYELYNTEGSALYASDEDLAVYAADQNYITADHILLSTKDLTTGEALTDEQKAEKKALAEEIKQKLDACEGDIDELTAAGQLFAPDAYADHAFDFKNRSNVVKALCLHVAHTCNLNCSYCFAAQGKFHGEAGLMSFETGKRALDFLIENSGTRRNLEVDFFGGEPLMNFEVCKQLVAYARSIEKKYNKNFRFTMTTNGIGITDEVIDWCNKECHNVVLSLDGRKEVNDRFRVDLAGNGSYDRIVPKFQKLVKARGGQGYYMRGTFTHHNVDFTKDLFHMADDLGFTELSMEPVVAPPDSPEALTEEDLPKLFDQYELLANDMLRRQKAGKPITFYHYILDLKHGPCIYKRISGCGSGTEYMAVTPWGDLYPCHQFVGDPAYKLGNVWDGVTNTALRDEFKLCNVYARPDCKDCWARLYCAGGCAANALHATGDIHGTYEYGCKVFRKRMECALMMQVAQRLDPELAKNAVRFESDCDGCGEGNDGACEK